MAKTLFHKYSFFLLLLFISVECVGCSCKKSEILPSDYFNAQHIFLANIESIDDCNVKFKVLKEFKGNIDKSKAYSNTICDVMCPQFGFKEGDEWFIWGIMKDNVFYTDACYRNTQISAISKHEIKMLNLLSERNGLINIYSSNNTLLAKGEICDKEPNKYWEFYNFDGTLSCVGKFENGHKIKRWKYYSKVTSNNKLGIKPSRIEYYDKNGYIKKEIEFNENNKIISCSRYKNSKRHGLNFSPWYRQRFKNGKREGRYISRHYKTKNLQVTGKYKNDIPIGKFEYFDENGTKIYETYNESLNWIDVYNTVTKE